MSLITCQFFSQSLGTMAKVMVCLPSPESHEVLSWPLDRVYPQSPGYRVLYLLHGMFGDETVWLRRTNVERYAKGLQLALVMPYGENSYYADTAYGPKYFTYLTEELPRFIQTTFPVSRAPKDTYIAGLSMGGYGACRAALTFPERYAGYACLSGAVDLEALGAMAGQPAMQTLLQGVFSRTADFAACGADIYTLADGLKAEGVTPPPAYIACGTEDALCYPMTLRLRDKLQELAFPIEYAESKAGHSWAFWDEQIQRVLAWLPC